VSLAEQVSKQLKVNRPNVLTIDIERIPGSITLDFWDLNQYKGRRLPGDRVTDSPRTICAAWHWYGQPDSKVHFAAEWTHGREGMLRAIWEAYDQADVIYGHNVVAFDTKMLNAEWLLLGLPTPSTFRALDTLKEARKTFGFESNTLASLTKKLGIETKTDKYDVQTARDAVAGNKAAQRKLKAYNVGDVIASRALVDRLRGWLPTHPHDLMGTANDRPTCNQCWGDNLEPIGPTMTQGSTVLTRNGYRCQDCGGVVVAGVHSRVAVTRGAR